MRIIVLRPYAPNCYPIFMPLGRLGHEIFEINYYTPGAFHDHSGLPTVVGNIAPDAIVMIGHNDFGEGFVPPPDILGQLAARWPFVHICCDGSEDVWWPQLEKYRAHAPSMLHLNIDGVRRGFFEDPSERTTLTTLCPIDHYAFAGLPWGERHVVLGFCGGWTQKEDWHPRGVMMREIVRRNLAVRLVNRPFTAYESYMSFMSDCRGVLNHAATGTADHMHVKARVVETAFSCAVLVEQRGSPSDQWFVANHDYMTWNSIDDLSGIMAWIEHEPEYAEAMARRLQRKMLEKHTAAVVWDQVFERLMVPR